jgi:hypothetical protein
MKITENLDNFDSNDAYFIEVFVSGNNVAVPYSNLGVSDHPAFNQGESAYISRAILFVQDLTYLKVDDNVLFGERPPFGEKVWFFGGLNLNGEGGIQEFELASSNLTYLIPEASKVTDFQFGRPDPADTSMHDHFFLEVPEFPEIGALSWVPALFR